MATRMSGFVCGYKNGRLGRLQDPHLQGGTEFFQVEKEGNDVREEIAYLKE